eukprot:1253962-Rhodomonas_salina.7
MGRRREERLRVERKRGIEGCGRKGRPPRGAARARGGRMRRPLRGSPREKGRKDGSSPAKGAPGEGWWQQLPKSWPALINKPSAHMAKARNITGLMPQDAAGRAASKGEGWGVLTCRGSVGRGWRRQLLKSCMLRSQTVSAHSKSRIYCTRKCASLGGANREQRGHT